MYLTPNKKALLFTTTANYIPKNIFENHFTIAVDGGLNFLIENNINPDIYIGDADSVLKKNIDLIRKNIPVLTSKQEKDETDTELAIKYCIENHFTHLTIINSLRFRFDHTLGILSNLEFGLSQGLNICVESNKEIVYILDKKAQFTLNENTIFSIIPVSESAKISELSGCKYPLENHILYREKSVGISNESLKKNITIDIKYGKILLIINK